MKLTKYLRDAFVEAVMQDVPTVDYDDQIRKLAHDAALTVMPSDVFKAYKKHPEWFKPAGKYIPEVGYVYLPMPMPDSAPLKPEVVEACKALAAKRTEQREARRALRLKLEGVAKGCNTVAALHEALPDLKGYADFVKSETNQFPLAVTGVVEALRTNGWSKKGEAA